MKKYIGILTVLVFLFSCSKESKQIVVDRPDGCDSIGFHYSTDIKPIIASNCSGATCHSGGNGNYNFSTYGVLADRIKAGTFEYRLLLPADDPQHMPENGTMNACNLYRVITWIRQGYPNN